MSERINHGASRGSGEIRGRNRNVLLPLAGQVVGGGIAVISTINAERVTPVAVGGVVLALLTLLPRRLRRNRA